MAAIRGECKPYHPVFEIPSTSGWIPLSRYHMDVFLTKIDRGSWSYKELQVSLLLAWGYPNGYQTRAPCSVIPLQSDHSSSAFDCYTALPPTRYFGLSSKMVFGMQSLGDAF